MNPPDTQLVYKLIGWPVTLNTPNKATLQLAECIIPNWDNSSTEAVWGISVGGRPPDLSALYPTPFLANWLINELSKKSQGVTTLSGGFDISVVQTRLHASRLKARWEALDPRTDEYRVAKRTWEDFLLTRKLTDRTTRPVQTLT